MKSSTWLVQKSGIKDDHARESRKPAPCWQQRPHSWTCYRARCAVGRTAVHPALARQQPGMAGCPQGCTTLQHQAAPAVGLAIMVVIMAATRGTLQGNVGTDRIAATGTDQNTQNPDTGRHGRNPAPRCYVETDAVGGGEVHSEAVAAAHGARECPAPIFWGDTQRSGWSSRGAAGPPNSWVGGARHSQLAEASGTDDNIEAPATKDKGRLEGMHWKGGSPPPPLQGALPSKALSP